MVKMVVSDIDGTIVEEGSSKIKQEYFDILNKLVDKGNVVTIASGRNITEIDAAFKPIKDRVYYIANNGGAISKGDKILLHNFFDKEDICEVLKFFETDPLIKQYSIVASAITEGVYVNTKDISLAYMLENTYGAKVILCDDFNDVISTLLKINIFVSDEKVKQVYEYVKKLFGNKFSILISGRYWVDICDKKTNKGNAVSYLQKLEKILPEETVVLGDNFNDIDMLKKGKYSFVPITSDAEVKKYAKYIMPSYKEDGALQVFKAINDYN